MRNSGLREAAWILAALAALLIWHRSAHAACDSAAEDAMFFMAPLPDPGHPQPCCATAAVRPAASAQKLASDAGALRAEAGLRIARAGEAPSAAVRGPLPDRPWRPYCARSSRLLR